MITKYGMSDELGPISFTSGHNEVFLGRDYGQTRNYSENVASSIDAEMNSIITGAYKRCENILTTDIDKLHAVAQYLIEHEKMNGETFKSIMTGASQAEEQTSDVTAEATEETEE